MFTSLCESRELHAKILCGRQFPIFISRERANKALSQHRSLSLHPPPEILFSPWKVDTIWGDLRLAEVFVLQSSFLSCKDEG